MDHTLVEGWEFYVRIFEKVCMKQQKKMNGIEIQISWATINQKNWKLWYNDKACNCEKSNWLHIKTLCFYITSGV